MNEKLINYLKEFITEKRYETFLNVLQYRTRYITVVLEDIYQSHNASAVLRTCDCFGIQDVYIIENINKYTVNPDVALGSSKWVTLYNFNKKDNNTFDTIQKLKKKGYRIVATSPHTNDSSLDNFELEKGKTALLFGTELTGLSNEALDNADEYLRIPMYGFTESFNISVSAALIIYHLSEKLRKSAIPWELDTDEKNEILLYWLKNSINNGDKIFKKYLEELKNK